MITVVVQTPIGGASIILATAPSAQAISSVVDGLSPNGNLVVPAAAGEPLAISTLSLILGLPLRSQAAELNQQKKTEGIRCSQK